MTKEEEIKVQIKMTEYWLTYFCTSEISGKARKHMVRQVNEWKKQLDVSRKS